MSRNSRTRRTKKGFSYYIPHKARFFGTIVLLIVLYLLYVLAINWKYTDYFIERSDLLGYSSAYTYYNSGDNVLKCASDSADLITKDGQLLWSINYEMNNPKVSVYGEMIAIYDQNGTTIVICDASGEKGKYNADMPIRFGSISLCGSFAAILDNGETAVIDYYDSQGNRISTIRTTMEYNGYPMKTAVSENGNVVAVSFLDYVENVQTARVCFYDFGDDGANATDHITGVFVYESCIIPELEYLENDHCVAYGTDKIMVFDCRSTPTESKKIDLKGKANSIFSDRNMFGYVVNESGKQNTAYVFDEAGNEKITFDMDFAYNKIFLKDSRLVMYDRNRLCYYSMLGKKKFEKQFDTVLQQVISLDDNRFGCVSGGAYTVIRLD